MAAEEERDGHHTGPGGIRETGEALKALVTGGSGFLGSRLVHSIGGEVTVLDRRPVPGALFMDGDIRDESLDLSGFDIVLHLAAVSSSRLAEKDRKRAWDVNVNGTLNLCRKLGKGQRLVFTSTAQVYGASSERHKESEAPSPSNFYALTKLVGEEMVRFHSSSCGFSSVIFRIFNTYSPDQPPGLLVGDAIQRYRSEGDIAVRDPDSVLDLVHVDDAVRALSGSHGLPEGTYNLCTGTGTRVREVYDAVAGYLGKERRHTLLGGKKSVLIGDNAKLRALGYAFRGFSLP